MLNNLNREIYGIGEIIFNEGDAGDCAYLIEDGIVEILVTIDGREQRVNQIGRSELFGEVALIDHQPRTATARAQEKVVLITIQRQLVNELLEKTDPIVRHLLLVILDRYRNKRGTSLPQSAAQQLDQAEVTTKRNALRSEATQKLTMANDIGRALVKDEFEMYYQPICALSSGQVAGYEALIRWRHPKDGLISPLDFLWLAEQTGQIREIGLWTLERACRDWPVLRKSTNIALPFVSVNMSPSQLTGDSFVDDVKSIITRHRMPPTELKLELTETVIINKPDVALNLLKQLTELGSTLALDDFGTGHSSLETLNRYPIGTMKVDRSFTSTMLTSAQSWEIVNSSIQLAHSLGMDVVAEGIETEEVRMKLLELKCNFGQGWLFGRPSELKNITTPQP
ncbi:MAG: EAL domain-containing protein [Gallionellaceae bacterium]|jgi:EAL domain-containing protein (putative c-di-GMP-specific phosphodiesterase class I)